MKYKIGETFRHRTYDGLIIKILSNKDKYNHYRIEMFENTYSIVGSLGESYIEDFYFRISKMEFDLEKLLHV